MSKVYTLFTGKGLGKDFMLITIGIFSTKQLAEEAKALWEDKLTEKQNMYTRDQVDLLQEQIRNLPPDTSFRDFTKSLQEYWD